MNEEIRKPLIRVEVSDKRVLVQGGTSVGNATTLLFKSTPTLLQPKVALILTAGMKVHIDGVGRQALPNVFYVVTTPSEWTQLLKEANHESTERSFDQGSS